MTFLDRVDCLLKSKGVSRNKALREAGLNHNAFINWQDRGSMPSAEALTKLARYLNTSVSYLLGETEDPSPPGKKKEPVTPDGAQPAGEDDKQKQQDIESLLNVQRAILSGYKTAMTPITAGMILVLSNYFNVSTDYLLGRSDDPTPPEGKKEPATLFKGKPVSEIQARALAAVQNLSEEEAAIAMEFIKFLKSQKKTQEQNT